MTSILTFIFIFIVLLVASLIPILIVLAIFISIAPDDKDSIDPPSFKTRCHHSPYYGHRWMDGFELDD